MPRLLIFHHFLLVALVYSQNDLDLTWGHEQSPFPNENVHQQFPDAVVGDDGSIHIVWLEQHGNQKSIMYCKSSDGAQNFTQPQQVNYSNNNIIAYMQSGPRIRAYEGKLYVTFMMHDETDYQSVFMSCSFDNGETWNEEVEISHQPHRNVYPDVEIDSNGEIHLIYYNFNQNWHFNGVFYAVSTQDSLNFVESNSLGVVGDGQEPCDCCQPDLALSNMGGVYVAYRNNISSNRDHYLVKMEEGDSTFSEPIMISNYEDYINFCPTSGPTISLNDSVISVSYFVYETHSSYVNYSSLSDIDFSNEIVLNDNGNQQNHSFSILHENFIHATWIENIAGNADIYYGALELGENELQNIQRVNQDSTYGMVTQKDPILLWADSSLFCFWSDGRSGDFQIYFSEATFDTITVHIDFKEPSIIYDDFYLYPAYPNPFNPVTTLRYGLPEDELVNITIYDMMGRQISTLVSGQQSAGYKSVRWNATNDKGAPVSAGLYLYTIQAGEYIQTKKMVLLK